MFRDGATDEGTILLFQGEKLALWGREGKGKKGGGRREINSKDVRKVKDGEGR